MGDKPSINIPINTEKGRFANHLEIGNNQRIIFSSPFGSGKTYFLERFFDEKKEVYEPFFLSPVHYSVSRNEDVFEYIKYDILINLLMKENVKWDVTQIEDQLIAQFFVINNFGAIAKELINFLGKTGRLTGTIEGDTVGKISSVTNTVISNLSKLKSKYDKYKQEINTNDKYTSIKFLEELSQQTGSIFEYNDITALINNALNSIDADKKKVLIIDDLDRMDPEHIFRILNVFSAQFDHERFGYNKFAFNKVIIVCDLNNIRNLFAHKYGSNVDFSGYIDKFYSVEPFMFDNRKAVVDKTHEFISSIKNTRYKEYISEIYPLIDILVTYKVITLRKLVEKKDRGWTYSQNSRNDFNRFYPEKTLLFIDFILFLYGYIVEDLYEVLEKIDAELDYNLYAGSSFKFICPLLQLTDKPIDGDMKISLRELGINITLKVINPYYSDCKIEIVSIQKLDGTTITKVPFFKLLSICVRNFEKIMISIQ